MTKGLRDDSVEEYVWNAPIGQISEVLTGSEGFHIVIVEERRLSERDKYDSEITQRASDN